MVTLSNLSNTKDSERCVGTQQLGKERLFSMLALIAVLEAAVATGLGIGLVPAVNAGALDGFAAGLLVSGTIFLLLMGQWHGMRRIEPVASAARRIAVPRLPGRLRGDYPRRGRQEKVADAHGGEAGECLPPADLPTGSLPAGGLPSGEPTDERAAGGSGETRRPGGYRSRHRLSGPEGSPSLPDGRRAPRHAAPSSVKVRRRGGFIQVKALAATD
jgi:hypothetical protein